MNVWAAVAVGWLLLIVVTVWLWNRLHRKVGWKRCPRCGGEGTMAPLDLDRIDGWVVTCHGYFWQLTDEELMETARGFH